MDRIDAMKVFVAALDEGSLAGAGRKLGRSPAAVSRAIAFLEAHVGAELLHRTTRSIKLSEAGERYAAACRRVLTELEEADILAGGERAAPRGTLALTAPGISGEMVLRPVLDAFLDAYPTVSARLLLLDRSVNLIDEGFDVALRIGKLADSPWWRAGSARCAGWWWPRRVTSSKIRASRSRAIWPSTRSSRWRTFPIPGPFRRSPGSSVPRTVQLTPRLVINSIRGAVASAAGGRGVALFLFLSGGRQGAERRARNRAGGPRARSAAGACDRAARPAYGAEGARLHGFCGAEAAQPFCAAGEGLGRVGWVERSDTHQSLDVRRCASQGSTHQHCRWRDGYRFAPPILRFYAQ